MCKFYRRCFHAINTGLLGLLMFGNICASGAQVSEEPVQRTMVMPDTVISFQISNDFLLEYKEQKVRVSREFKQYVNSYLKAIPILHLIEIPGGKYCDYATGYCKTINVKPFLMGKYEVTIKQWSECIDAGVCPDLPSVKMSLDSQQAVSGLSLSDADLYLTWLKKRFGIPVRLPTDFEWEYAVYAGEQPPPQLETTNDASVEDCTQPHIFSDMPSPYPDRVGEGVPNAFGLYDMDGNVSELTSDNVLRGRSWLKTTCGPASNDHTEKLRNSKARNITSGMRIAVPLLPSTTEKQPIYYCIGKTSRRLYYSKIPDHYREYYDICYETADLEQIIKKHGL
jgi:hypothetical protein